MWLTSTFIEAMLLGFIFVFLLTSVLHWNLYHLSCVTPVYQLFSPFCFSQPHMGPKKSEGDLIRYSLPPSHFRGWENSHLTPVMVTWSFETLLSPNQDLLSKLYWRTHFWTPCPCLPPHHHHGHPALTTVSSALSFHSHHYHLLQEWSLCEAFVAFDVDSNL